MIIFGLYIEENDNVATVFFQLKSELQMKLDLKNNNEDDA